MKNIDATDKQILYQLDINSRQSFSTIGRKVNLDKGVVRYRIENLVSKGIIKDFYTYINAKKLGFIPIRLHFILQYMSSKKEQEMIDFFMKNKLTTLVITTSGFFDMSVVFDISDINDFISLWKRIQQQFGYYIQKQFLTFFIDQISFVSSYLLLGTPQKSERRYSYLIKGGTQVKYDKTDIDILKHLAPHARMSLTDLADNLDMSPNTISSRIARLKAKGVISGYRIRMDSQKLGFYFVKIYIKLRDYNSISTLIEYLRYNPYLTAVDRNTGNYQLELEFYLEDIVKIHQIMDDLINRYNFQIKDYTYITARKVHKYLYFPPITVDSKH